MRLRILCLSVIHFLKLLQTIENSEILTPFANRKGLYIENIEFSHLSIVQVGSSTIEK